MCSLLAFHGWLIVLTFDATLICYCGHTLWFGLLQWYYVAVGFLLVPFMGVANSYGAGLTDQDNSSMYGKLCIFIFAAWAGTANQGVIAGLGMCGVVLAATSQAANLMQVCNVRTASSNTLHSKFVCKLSVLATESGGKCEMAHVQLCLSSGLGCGFPEWFPHPLHFCLRSAISWLA